jgi:hypothetical protein
MGMYDTVMVPCPKCHLKVEAQSKGGLCNLDVFEFGYAPEDVMSDVNRHAPFTCGNCGTAFKVTCSGYLVVQLVVA